jgi:hypothetical protein
MKRRGLGTVGWLSLILLYTFGKVRRRSVVPYAIVWKITTNYLLDQFNSLVDILFHLSIFSQTQIFSRFTNTHTHFNFTFWEEMRQKSYVPICAISPTPAKSKTIPFNLNF